MRNGSIRRFKGPSSGGRNLDFRPRQYPLSGLFRRLRPSRRKDDPIYLGFSGFDPGTGRRAPPGLLPVPRHHHARIDEPPRHGTGAFPGIRPRYRPRQCFPQPVAGPGLVPASRPQDHLHQRPGGPCAPDHGPAFHRPPLRGRLRYHQRRLPAQAGAQGL